MKGERPRTVDVVIPARNRFELTTEAIDSVWAQTFEDWRLIVVDDASDDGSLERLLRLAGGDRRIDIVQRSEAGGPQMARATGYRRATADFVAFLDSDDLWDEKKLEKQLEQYRRDEIHLSELGTVLCWHTWFDEKGPGYTRKPEGTGWVNPLITSNMSTPLIRRDAIETAGGMLPPSGQALFTCEAVEFYIRLTEVCQFSVVEELLVGCRTHEGPRASDKFGSELAAREMADVLAVHERRLMEYTAEYADLLGRTGARYLAAGKRRAGMEYMKAAFRTGGAGTWGHLVRKYGPFTLKRVLLDVVSDLMSARRER